MPRLDRLELRNILDVALEIRMLVRELRNREGVRKFMYTDHVISEAEHLRWLEGLRSNERQQVFVVFFDGEPAGVVSLANLDRAQARADWAFYLRDELRGQGVGSLLEYRLLEYAFEEIGLEKLNCEVLATNPGVIRLHKKFGFVEEGVRRKNVIKDGERVDVCLLGMLREEWRASKPDVERILLGSERAG